MVTESVVEYSADFYVCCLEWFRGFAAVGRYLAPDSDTFHNRFSIQIPVSNKFCHGVTEKHC